MSNDAIITALRLQVERLQADLDYEQRAHKNLMIDFMKVEGPVCETRSTLLAKAEALEDYSRAITEEWILKGESYGLNVASGRALVMSAAYRKQAEGEG